MNPERGVNSENVKKTKEINTNQTDTSGTTSNYLLFVEHLLIFLYNFCKKKV